MRARLLPLPVIGTLLRIQQRVKEIEGSYLASSIALAAFLSIFPLMIAGIAIVGFVSQGDATFVDDLIENLALTGSAAESMREAVANAEDSRRAASVVGVVGLLWSGLRVVGAIQRVVNASWQVTGRGLADKGVALVWLAGSVLLFVASFALTTLLNFLPAIFAPINLLLGLGIGFVLFLWTFRALGNIDVGIRNLVPGALFCAIGFEILKLAGSLVVPRLVASSSQLYGSIGIVFAIISWLVVFGHLLVWGTVLNVIRYEEGAGTVTVEIEVPRVDGEGVPLTTDRSGAVVERAAGSGTVSTS